MNDRIFIGLGSNLGNSTEIISKAIEILAESVVIVRQSNLIITPPWGNINQPDFINGVIEIKSIFSPNELLEHLLNIEIKLGRVRDQKWGPRLIDLDLLSFGNLILNEKNLILPHPFCTKRYFVLAPWTEIAPEYILPLLNRSISTLLEELKSEEINF